MKILSFFTLTFLSLAVQAQTKTKVLKPQQKILTPVETKSIGPKQDDPRQNNINSTKAIVQKDTTEAIGPKQDDPLKRYDPNDPQAIGPKQDDPRTRRKNDTTAISNEDNRRKRPDIHVTDTVKKKPVSTPK